MRFLRSIAVSVTGMVATYALKKIMNQIELQSEAARQQAEAARQASSNQAPDMKTVKRLKQDPVTGVYYAED
jgi:hypothetical protein